MSRVICTIGFAGKSAEDFFALLKENGIATLVDIRLNNAGQLAGFAKARDLEYFLRELAGIGYVHYPLLAPSSELLAAYRAKQVNWDDYETAYAAILKQRKAAAAIKRDFPLWKQPVCLLCSEPTADHCHRRLAAEFIAKRFKLGQVLHL